MSRLIGVLGANGFIGARTVERMHLGGWAQVRPIVRSPAALARASRFAIDGRVADACNMQALISAFEGCDAVVNSVAGDPRFIVNSIDSVYRAADAARVRRLIYISSASVHGQSPPTGTDETSALSDHQSIQYNNAKVRAEHRLLELRRSGKLEVVILRPAIVFGPRSQWTGGFADELLAGTAYLVEGGNGVCNSSYIDNVVHAIQLAIDAPNADSRAYLIVDAERITWAQFCKPIADALGFDLTELRVDMRSFQKKCRIVDSWVLRRAVNTLPEALKQSVKAGYREWAHQAWRSKETQQREVSEERALLHCCKTKLPFTRAERELHYQPIVNFDEASVRSVRWLTFAGYPTVRTSH